MNRKALFAITLATYFLVCCWANDVESKKDGNLTRLADKEDDHVETFQEFEGKIKRGMNSVIRKILPILITGASKSQVSGPCTSSIMKIIGGVRQLKEWALRFVDSAGKLPPGILEGTSLSLGDYDQCLQIKVGKRDNPPLSQEDVIFKGKYCLIENHRPEVLTRAIKEYQDGNKDAPIAKTKTILNLFVRYKHLTNTTLKFGVCVPSTCTVADLESILNSESLRAIGKLDVAYCEEGMSKEVSTEQIIILVIFGVFGSCIIFGTFYDAFIRIHGYEDEKASAKGFSLLSKFSRSVSLYTNTLSLFDTKKVDEPLRCLCAIRVITVLLTIYSHTYGHIHDLHFQKFSKPANFLRFFDSFAFAGIANGSVGVDTIVFVAGITVSYSRWRYNSDKEKVKLKVCNLLALRFVRMSAAQLLVIALFLLFPLVGSGPLWEAYMDSQIKNCQERWWLNILYIGNFWSAKVTCLYQTWVLAVIMQLTVLSVFILYLLKRSPKAGVSLAGLITLSGVIGVAVMTIVHDLPGSMAFYMLDIRTGPLTWRRVYTLAYDHFGPFCIGLLTGYFLAVKKDLLNIGKKTCCLVWCISICCSSAVLFGLYEYRNGEKIDMFLATLYAVTHRNIWALGIAWLVIACTTNHAGVIKKVMESNVFVPLDRLCYLVFLVHIPIMFFHSGSIRERWYMGHFDLLFFAVGYMVLSLLLSAVLYVSFVCPYYLLENYGSSLLAVGKRTKNLSNTFPTTSFDLNSSRRKDSVSENGGCINLGFSKSNVEC